MARSPYADLPPEAFWRTGVAERTPGDLSGLYTPRVPLKESDRIATAGSCFAQHVGRTLKGAGLDVLDGEPLPLRLPDQLARRFGYGLFSARYGNIYTAQQLQQLLEECEGQVSPADPVWEKAGRFYDAQRPGLEPDGLESPEEVMAHRAQHLRAVKDTLSQADLFVFTFGLTEAWEHRETGTVYPTAPGTIAGDFDPDRYHFVNYHVRPVQRAFMAARRILMSWNPAMRFLITVSPVPLTATASGQHVEVATIRSKSVLRAACAILEERFENVDYFPSYEIITAPSARGAYFEPNMRSVSPEGVATVMRTFLAAHGLPVERLEAPGATPPPLPDPSPASEEEVICEEALLEAFSK